MSVINPDWRAGPEPDRMPGGIAFSAALHLLVFVLVIFGLPVFFHPRVAENPPIAVNLVHLAPHTRATHPNPELPHRHAAPKKPIPGPPTPKPEMKPMPPKPAPPPSAAVAKTEPKPIAPQTKVEPKAEPKPPAALPRPHPVAKTAEVPPPPLPEIKPVLPRPKPLAAALPSPPLPQVKPAPPRHQVAKKPKIKRNKYDPAMFASLLKNLAANQRASSENGRPQRDSVSSGRASSQPKAPLGATLSASEIALIREQIARCWNIPAGARGAKDLVIDIEVSLNPDGSVRTARILDQARLASDPVFRSAAESARRALFNPLCTPLHLPADRYSVWRNLELSFSPKDLL